MKIEGRRIDEEDWRRKRSGLERSACICRRWSGRKFRRRWMNETRLRNSATWVNIERALEGKVRVKEQRNTTTTSVHRKDEFPVVLNVPVCLVQDLKVSGEG